MYNLGELRYMLRMALGEPNASNSLYTDFVLNKFLNEGAYDMAVKCQPEETIHQITTELARGSTTEYAREYEMPAGTDEIFGASIWNGTEQQLRIRQAVPAMLNNTITGVPSRFYIRKSRQHIETNASGITHYPSDSGNMRFFIGLDPKPSGVFVVSVYHYARHFIMTNDNDVPVIPPEFRRTIIKYAQHLAYEMDDMHAMKNIAIAEYNAGVDACRSKMINMGQECAFPVVHIRDEEEDDYRGEDYYEVQRIS